MKKANTKHELNSALIGMLLGNAEIILDNKEYNLMLAKNPKHENALNFQKYYISKYLTPHVITDSVLIFKCNKLQYLYEDIYRKKQKCLKKNIANRFNKISLVLLYINCGEIKNNSIILNTQELKKHDNELLISAIKKSCKITMKLNEENKLYCDNEDYKNLFEIITTCLK